MKNSSALTLLFTSLLLAGCSPKNSDQPSQPAPNAPQAEAPTPSPETVAQTPSVTAPTPAVPTDSAQDNAQKPAADAHHDANQDANPQAAAEAPVKPAVDYDALQVVDGWFAHDGIMTCLSHQGCQNDGASYKRGETRKPDHCGITPKLADTSGYICDRVANAWRCQEETCTCAGTPIVKDALCLPTGPLSCQGTLANTKCVDGKLLCSGTEIPDALNKYECTDGNWKCIDDLCKCGNEQCHKTDVCKYNKFDRRYCSPGTEENEKLENDEEENEKLANDEFASFTLETIDYCGTCHDTGKIIVCRDEHECGTKDGEYYLTHAVVDERTLMQEAQRFTDPTKLPHFHDKNTVRTLSKFGDCVLDATSPDHIEKVKQLPGATYLGCDEISEVSDVPEFNEDEGQFENNEITCRNDTCAERTEPVVYYDVTKCVGGTLWCHGKNNKPTQKPKDDGYACQAVTALPNNAHHDDLKTWVCTLDAGCVCGQSKCTKDDACIDGVCVASAELTSTSPEQAAQPDTTVTAVDLPSPTEAVADAHEAKTDTPDKPTEIAAECVSGDCKCQNKPRPEGAPGDYACVFAKDTSKKRPVTSKKGEYVWKCTRPEGCKCGNSVCTGYSTCQDQQCMCNDTVAVNGFECDFSIPSSYYEPIVAQFCRNEQGCEFGFSRTKFNSSLEREPCGKYGNIVKPDGCYCNNTIADPNIVGCCSGTRYKLETERCYFDQAFAKEAICSDASCACKSGDGHTTYCPFGTVCQSGSCINPATKDNQPIPLENGYLANGLFKTCQVDACQCGDKTIKHGEGCLCALGQCIDYSDISGRLSEEGDFIRIGDAVIRTHTPFMSLKLEAEQETCEETDEIEPSDVDSDMQYIEIGKREMYCECSDCDLGNAVSTRICALPEGCVCGDTKCSEGSSCKLGKCFNTNGYACSSDTTSEDANHNCVCAGTVIPPLVKGYQCTSYGWLCNTDAGCTCGTATCNKDSVCVKPGLCI